MGYFFCRIITYIAYCIFPVRSISVPGYNIIKMWKSCSNGGEYFIKALLLRHAYIPWAGSYHPSLVVKGHFSRYLLWRGSHKWFLRGTFAACRPKTCQWILRAAHASVLSQSLQQTPVLHRYLVRGSKVRLEEINIEHYAYIMHILCILLVHVMPLRECDIL